MIHADLQRFAECATCGEKRTNQPISIISAANKLQDMLSLPMDRAPTHMYTYEYIYSNMEASYDIYEVVLETETQQHTYQAVFPVSSLRELHHNPLKQPGLEALRSTVNATHKTTIIL